MSWNIFSRVSALEVRVLVAESNARSLMKTAEALSARLQVLELNTPKSLSEAEVKKRLRAAAYSRNYYKMKKEAASKTAIPTAVDTATHITPERMKELVHQHTRPKKRMQSSAELAFRMGQAIAKERMERIVETHHTDMVNHPPHYKAGGIETIDFIEAKGLGYHLGNVVKYITRADHKGNKLEDLKKAQWYLSRAIEKLN
jgi:hypothetical protein